MATWVKLRDTDGKMLTVVSTHFNHTGAESARLIVGWVAENGAGTAVVAGDLNARDDSPAVAILEESFGDAHGSSETQPRGDLAIHVQ